MKSSVIPGLASGILGSLEVLLVSCCHPVSLFLFLKRTPECGYQPPLHVAKMGQWRSCVQRGYRSCLTRHLYLSAFFGRLKAGAGFLERARPRSMLHDISKVNSAHTIAIVPSLQHEEVAGIHIQASV